jgi:hypothetical protein
LNEERKKIVCARRLSKLSAPKETKATNVERRRSVASCTARTLFGQIFFLTCPM